MVTMICYRLLSLKNLKSGKHKVASKTGQFTANTILKALVNDKIIVQLREGSGPRSAIYALPSLIKISEGREVLDN